MKTSISLRLTMALVFCSLHCYLTAQTDSSWLDLGRIKLKKDFTQSVTIKGKDLEQMPFASLDEAINVWLYGVATNRLTVAYVIDGNMITDVNAYTIHDIEEITLVQNALVQLNGATREKQLILITTKKNRPNRSGVSVAGSSFAATNKSWYTPDYKHKSETNYYHRYDISAWRNDERIQYGITAGFLRDVYPYAGNPIEIKKPFQVSRFRFNGYLNARLNNNNNLWLRAGYAPGTQTLHYLLISSPPQDTRSRDRESFLTVEAGWTFRLSKRFTNDLSAGFSPATNKKHGVLLANDASTLPNFIRESSVNFKYKFNNLLINDHLTYHTQAGHWNVEPSLDLSFRSLNIKSTTEAFERNHTTGMMLGASFETSRNKYNVFLLTPSVNVYYKDLFNIQGGFVYNLSKDQDNSPEATKLLPFLTMAVDVLKVNKVNSKLNWKLFGSYAAGGNFADAAYLFNEAAAFQIQYPYPYPNRNYSSSTTPVLYGGDSANYSIQAGTTVGWLQGRLQGSYNFEKRRFTTLTSFNSFPVPASVPVNVHHSIHRLGVIARVLEKQAFNWQAALNVSAIKTKLELRTLTGPIIPYQSNQYKKPLFTGGFTNRLQYKKVMAGVDVLYLFNIKKYNGGTMGKESAFSFRNIYAGYQLQYRNRPLEVYVATRQPALDDVTMMPDKRTYYGAGFKAGL